MAATSKSRKASSNARSTSKENRNGTTRKSSSIKKHTGKKAKGTVLGQRNGMFTASSAYDDPLIPSPGDTLQTLSRRLEALESMSLYLWSHVSY